MVAGTASGHSCSRVPEKSHLGILVCKSEALNKGVNDVKFRHIIAITTDSDIKVQYGRCYPHDDIGRNAMCHQFIQSGTHFQQPTQHTVNVYTCVSMYVQQWHWTSSSSSKVLLCHSSTHRHVHTTMASKPGALCSNLGFQFETQNPSFGFRFSKPDYYLTEYNHCCSAGTR